MLDDDEPHDLKKDKSVEAGASDGKEVDSDESINAQKSGAKGKGKGKAMDDQGRKELRLVSRRYEV